MYLITNRMLNQCVHKFYQGHANYDIHCTLSTLAKLFTKTIQVLKEKGTKRKILTYSPPREREIYRDALIQTCSSLLVSIYLSTNI